LYFTVQPSLTLAGSPLNPAVVVQEYDRYNNLEIGDNSNPVTLTVATGPDKGDFTSDSIITATLNGGIATFSNLVLQTAGDYTLHAKTPSGISGPDSDTFTIIPLAPVRIAFTVEPSDTVAGQAISPSVQVSAYDRYGNLTTQ